MRYLWYYPVEWYMIDEDRGWVSCQFWCRMADPGDGSVHEFKCFSLLKYAGDGLWSLRGRPLRPGRHGSRDRRMGRGQGGRAVTPARQSSSSANSFTRSGLDFQPSEPST